MPRTFDRDVRRWVPTRSAKKPRPARRGRGSSLPFDGHATTHRSPERDRRPREWSGRSGLLLTPTLVDDRSSGTNLAFLRGRPRSRERLVQGLTFVLRQIIPLVVDDQIKLSAIGQRRWLVEAQPPVLHTGTQRSRVTTVWRSKRVGKSQSASPEQRAGPHSTSEHNGAIEREPRLPTLTIKRKFHTVIRHRRPLNRHGKAAASRGFGIDPSKGTVNAAVEANVFPLPAGDVMRGPCGCVLPATRSPVTTSFEIVSRV